MKGKSTDKTLAKILLILRDVYTRQVVLYRQAVKANDNDGLLEAQSAMMTCEEIAGELGIVLFSEAEKREMDKQV
jgi:hypothetical protein